MNMHGELAAAEKALDELARSVRSLQRSIGNTLDMRRLADDVSRIEVSLDALRESVAAPGRQVQQPKLEVIPDREYDHDFWMDAEDEGLGASDRHAP